MLIKSNVFCCGGLQLLVPSPGHFSVFRASIHASPCRSYATTHDTHDGCDFSWPTSATFTPYDLFKHKRDAPYSKGRFYDLVKFYHPDIPCNGHPLCRDISHEVRLQRYRLLVAANEILSDPTKRAAYDQFGAGWTLHPSPNYEAPSWHPGMKEYGPMYANATWEDWERWHNRHNAGQRQLVDHKTFMTFVVLLVLFGGTVNATWLGQRNASYGQRLRDVNDESLRFLSGRRENTANQMKSSEARVQHFLIRRDPSGSGLKGTEQPVYERVLCPRHSNTHDTEGQDAMQRDQSTGTEQSDRVP